MAYDHRKIEQYWQKKWDVDELYKTDENTSKETYYCLDMFPYPSGAGLHVGHPEGYTATDIVSRYKRMKGFEVLHPMGWDSFGLPAENYAIKTGEHPKKSTYTNIETFKRQIKSIGLSYDWSREFATSDPEYYKWTQWFFLLMYKNDLAYKKKAKVNWCESCKTVLANEQVVSGLCERCKNEVIQKDLEQWFFRTTKYAESLLADLDSLDWPEKLKAMQRNWIGKSEGAEIDFAVKDSEAKIRVFTTRPDTLFGATYMVLAPEHGLIEELKDQIQNSDEVESYIEETLKKTEIDRKDETKEKTGIKLEGVTAVNPANKEEIPVFIADYVLKEYGTGAIVAVPAHDQRDYLFAKKFNLQIRQVVAGGSIEEESFLGKGALMNSDTFDGMSSVEAIANVTEFVGGELTTTYKLRDWLISRQRYWGTPIPIINCAACGDVAVPESDLPVVLPTDIDFDPTGESPLAKSKSFQESVECPKCGGSENVRREVDTMDTFVCSSWYYFRYLDSSNEHEFCSKEKMNKWMPVDLYIGGAEHAVGHLMYARFFTKVLHGLDYISFNEPFKKLENQGMILAGDGKKMSKSLGNVVNPDEVVNEYGADTLRMYEMFMGPLADAKPWDTKGIKGIRRFLDKVSKLSELAMSSENESEDALKRAHKTIKKVTEDIESLHFNTAISSMMMYVNEAQKNTDISLNSFNNFLKVLAPFAPHLTEELWKKLGHDTSIHLEEWPEYDESKTKEDSKEIAIQVNGKVRSKITLSVTATEEEVMKLVMADVNIIKHTEDKEIRKTIYVPGKIVSIVVS